MRQRTIAQNYQMMKLQLRMQTTEYLPEPKARMQPREYLPKQTLRKQHMKYLMAWTLRVQHKKYLMAWTLRVQQMMMESSPHPGADLRRGNILQVMGPQTGKS